MNKYKIFGKGSDNLTYFSHVVNYRPTKQPQSRSTDTIATRIAYSKFEPDVGLVKGRTVYISTEKNKPQIKQL